MALLENNFGFANALIEKGVNLENFLTHERLDRLYNSRKGSKVCIRRIILKYLC